MPTPNASPRRKQAARTIKRAVMKHSVKKAFSNYTNSNYANIKSGNAPAKAQALYRRMKMFPVTINTPLYRGVINKNGTLMKKLEIFGNMQNSFASFSRSRGVAESFLVGMPSMDAKHILLVLPPGRYPAINSRKFRSRIQEECEVLLAPGNYVVNTSKTKPGNFKPRFGRFAPIHVNYVPSNHLTHHKY
jgi:hypothetical protein